MWTLIVAGYLIGLAATAAMIRRDRTVGAGWVVESTCAVLWPVYWSIVVLWSYRDRRRNATN